MMTLLPQMEGKVSITVLAACVWATYARNGSALYRLSRPSDWGQGLSRVCVVRAPCHLVAQHRAAGRFALANALPFLAFGDADLPWGSGHVRCHAHSVRNRKRRCGAKTGTSKLGSSRAVCEGRDRTGVRRGPEPQIREAYSLTSNPPSAPVGKAGSGGPPPPSSLQDGRGRIVREVARSSRHWKGIRP